MNILEILAEKRGEKIHRDISFDEIQEASEQGLAPTFCPEGCLVSPLDSCPHGYKSIYLEKGEM